MNREWKIFAALVAIFVVAYVLPLGNLRIQAGIHEAFRLSGAFPDDFVHDVEVAERSGRVVESMGHLSRQYEEQAQAALSTLAVVAGFAVWGLVAAIIIFLIFRIFSFYVATIMDAANM